MNRSTYPIRLDQTVLDQIEGGELEWWLFSETAEVKEVDWPVGEGCDLGVEGCDLGV